MSALTTMVTGRCPQCDQGHVFDGFLSVRPKCEHCGVVFLRDAGSWTAGPVLSYMVGSVWFVGAAIVAVATGSIFDPGMNWILSGSTVVVVLVSMRPSKGLWVGMLHGAGLVYADPDPEPGEGVDKPSA